MIIIIIISIVIIIIAIIIVIIIIIIIIIIITDTSPTDSLAACLGLAHQGTQGGWLGARSLIIYYTML